MPKWTIFEISFIWKYQSLSFHYWEYLTNFWRNNWRSIIDVVERLCFCLFEQHASCANRVLAFLAIFTKLHLNILHFFFICHHFLWIQIKCFYQIALISTPSLHMPEVSCVTFICSIDELNWVATHLLVDLDLFTF